MDQNNGFPVRGLERSGPGWFRLGVAAMVCLGCFGGPLRSGASDRDGSSPPRLAAANTPHETGSAGARAALVHDPLVNRDADAIAQAKQVIADCQARFRSVQDYTCKFHKQERIDGKLVKPHVMQMKSRSAPLSFYFKFDQPNAGREAIYVAGKNKGRVYAHDVGIGRFLAGTLNLDPLGSMAMEENRHPITEAGIGALIETVRQRWEVELHPHESKVILHPNASVDQRPCTLIESIHPKPQADFLFHKVNLYVDKELGLPIRFEAYDWPRKAGHEPELVEEYTYSKLRINVGLGDKDFDPANKLYSFGRF